VISWFQNLRVCKFNSYRYRVAQGGWGLAFVVYPTAMGLFGPGAGQFFAVCFWVMVLCLGVDSAFSLIESPICAVGLALFTLFLLAVRLVQLASATRSHRSSRLPLTLTRGSVDDSRYGPCN
jgi:hypothetical protein